LLPASPNATPRPPELLSNPVQVEFKWDSGGIQATRGEQYLTEEEDVFS